MRTAGLLCLVAGLIGVTALLLGSAPSFITDYFNRDQLEVLGPGLLLLGAIVIYVTREEG